MLCQYFKVRYENLDGYSSLIFPVVRFPIHSDSYIGDSYIGYSYIGYSYNTHVIKQHVEKSFGIVFPKTIVHLGVTYHFMMGSSARAPSCVTSALYDLRGEKVHTHYMSTSSDRHIPVEDLFKHLIKDVPFIPFTLSQF